MIPGKIKIRLLQPWQGYMKHSFLNPPGVLRDWLIGNGYAEVVGPVASTPESGQSPVETLLEKKARRKTAKKVDAQ